MLHTIDKVVMKNVICVTTYF